MMPMMRREPFPPANSAAGPMPGSLDGAGHLDSAAAPGCEARATRPCSAQMPVGVTRRRASIFLLAIAAIVAPTVTSSAAAAGAAGLDRPSQPHRSGFYRASSRHRFSPFPTVAALFCVLPSAGLAPDCRAFRETNSPGAIANGIASLLILAIQPVSSHIFPSRYDSPSAS